MIRLSDGEDLMIILVTIPA